ncbi:MAG: nucleotidyltransferase domain-containing protein [Nanoarchaeota archaeon]
MLSNTKEKQIQWILTHPEQKVTISGLAVGSGTAYPQTYNNVQDLVQQKIFATESVPPAQIVTISPEAPVDILLSIESRRKQEFLEKYTWVRLMIDDLLRYTGDYFFILAVFGSYAKGLETKKSDLDMLLIVPSREVSDMFENAIRKIYAPIKKSPIVVTSGEFMEMIQKGGFNVGTEAKKHHVILYGAEQWYALIRKAEK